MPSPPSRARDGTAPERLLLRNVVFSLAGRLWLFAVTIAVTPVLLQELGRELFALYSLVIALAGYLAVLDLGFGIATVKHVAEYRGRGDHPGMARAIGTSMAVYLALGVAGSAIIIGAASFLVRRVFDVPPELLSVAHTAVTVTGIGFTATMMVSMLNAIPTALQRMDITNRRNALFGTALLGGSALLVHGGHGVVAIVVYGVIVNCVAAASFAVTTARLLPGISLRPRVDPGTLRTLGTFSALKFVNQVSTSSVLHLDKILIAVLAPLAAVAPYVIAVTLSQRLTMLVGTIAGPFLPAASEAHGGAHGRTFSDLYARGTKLVGLMVLPLGVLLVLFADPILLLWVGESMARDTAPLLRILAVAWMINAFSTMPAVACDSRSRPGITTAFSVGSAVLNVGLAVALIPRFGARGAAIAVLVNSVVLVPVFVAYVHHKVVKLPVRAMLRRSLAQPALGAIALIPLGLAARGWATTVPALLMGLVLCLIAYVGLTIALGTYDATDRSVLALLDPRRRTRVSHAGEG